MLWCGSRFKSPPSFTPTYADDFHSITSGLLALLPLCKDALRGNHDVYQLARYGRRGVRVYRRRTTPRFCTTAQIHLTVVHAASASPKSGGLFYASSGLYLSRTQPTRQTPLQWRSDDSAYPRPAPDSDTVGRNFFQRLNLASRRTRASSANRTLSQPLPAPKGRGKAGGE